MAQYKCEDCGTVFDEALNGCPNCGCPKEACKRDGDQTQPLTEKEVKKSEPTKAQYYYVDFEWFRWLSSDSYILIFLLWLPPLRWLCAAWHIGGTNAKGDYETANAIMFLCNRIWKFLVYPYVWLYCKCLLPLLFSLLVGMLMSDIVSNNYELYDIYRNLVIIWNIVGIVAIAYWFAVGFGKSIQRYGIPVIACLKDLSKKYWKSMKNS